MNTNARVLLKIYGCVQGVFFRVETKRKADHLGLTGWVRNNSDGTVECLAEGEKNKLEQFIDWCYQGSDGAKVDNIEKNWAPYQGEFNNFSIQ